MNCFDGSEIGFGSFANGVGGICVCDQSIILVAMDLKKSDERVSAEKQCKVSINSNGQVMKDCGRRVLRVGYRIVDVKRSGVEM